MSRIGVIAALPAEARALAGTPIEAGSIVSPMPDLDLAVCGIGPDRALSAARDLLQRDVSMLLSWGCGAGLVETAAAGTLFVPETVIDAGNNQRFPATPAWHDRITGVLGRAGIAFETGPLVSGGELLTTSTAKRALQQKSGAAIADMESAAVARAAAAAGRAFGCIRVVADNLSVRLPEALLPALDEYGRPQTIVLMRTLLRQPSLIPQIMRLAQAFKAARGRLAEVAGLAGQWAVCT